MTPAETALSTGQWMLILGVAVLLFQTLYRVWDRKDNKEILKAISDVISHFDSHIERTKSIKGMVKDLHTVHKATDSDGRPLVYMPREILEIQHELAKMTHSVAQTQHHIVDLMTKLESSVSKNSEKFEQAMRLHSDACRGQFETLKDNIKG